MATRLLKIEPRLFVELCKTRVLVKGKDVETFEVGVTDGLPQNVEIDTDTIPFVDRRGVLIIKLFSPDWDAVPPSSPEYTVTPMFFSVMTKKGKS